MPTKRAIDPITLEVLRNRLEMIAEEMQSVLARSARSSNIKEAIDASCAIFDSNVQAIAQANALPIHLGSLDPALQRICEEYQPEQMRPGDVFIMNDPYQGGQHVPDVVVVVPVIVDGATVALTCSMAHHQDMGGMSPGSTPTNATDVYQEGLVIPPVKLYDEGRANETLLQVIRRNVRLPEITLGDIMAQVAAASTGRNGLTSLFAAYGADEVLRYAKALQDRSEVMTRQLIEAIPDGDYEFTDYLDNDGIELDRLIKIHATVSIKGSQFIVDFSGTDSQVRGPFNAVPSVALSAVRYVVRAVTDSDIPTNAGCYRPITVRVPRGSLLDPIRPAPVNSRAVTLRRMLEVVMGALVKAIPHRVTAANNGHPLLCLVGGVDTGTGRPYVTTLATSGGMGARPTKDGAETIQTDASNAMNIPAEHTETYYPLRVTRWALRDDSGGAGRWRGGVGMEYFVEVVRGELHVSHRGERHRTSPWGLFGGQAGARAKTEVVSPDGRARLVPSKEEFIIGPGWGLHFYTTGGGGYGDPLERDPKQVLEDVLDRKVSGASAERSYGVVLTAGEPPSVDQEATSRVRERVRQERGAVSWTYDRGETRE
jgi:N-methylhydantoinase B